MSYTREQIHISQRQTFLITNVPNYLFGAYFTPQDWGRLVQVSKDIQAWSDLKSNWTWFLFLNEQGQEKRGEHNPSVARLTATMLFFTVPAMRLLRYRSIPNFSLSAQCADITAKYPYTVDIEAAQVAAVMSERSLDLLDMRWPLALVSPVLSVSQLGTSLRSGKTRGEITLDALIALLKLAYRYEIRYCIVSLLFFSGLYGLALSLAEERASILRQLIAVSATSTDTMPYPLNYFSRFVANDYCGDMSTTYVVGSCYELAKLNYRLFELSFRYPLVICALLVQMSYLVWMTGMRRYHYGPLLRPTILLRYLLPESWLTFLTISPLGRDALGRHLPALGAVFSYRDLHQHYTVQYVASASLFIAVLLFSLGMLYDSWLDTQKALGSDHRVELVTMLNQTCILPYINEATVPTLEVACQRGFNGTDDSDQPAERIGALCEDLCSIQSGEATATTSLYFSMQFSAFILMLLTSAQSAVVMLIIFGAEYVKCDGVLPQLTFFARSLEPPATAEETSFNPLQQTDPMDEMPVEDLEAGWVEMQHHHH